MRAPAVLLMALVIVASGVCTAAEPEIVVMAFQKSTYFAVGNVRMGTVWFVPTTSDAKFIPLSHYDLCANLLFDLLDALAADKRARWREATPADGLNFPTLWDTENPPMPAGFKGDGVLLVFVSGFGASSFGAFMQADIMLLNQRGSRVWKKNIFQLQRVKQKVTEWLTEDPASLTSHVNELQEGLVQAICKKIAGLKVKS